MDEKKKLQLNEKEIRFEFSLFVIVSAWF